VISLLPRAGAARGTLPNLRNPRNPSFFISDKIGKIHGIHSGETPP